MINRLPLEKDERIQAVLPVKEFNDDQFIFMATESGSVKKTKLSAYSRPMKTGIKAIKLRDGDRVVNAEITDGSKEIMLFSNSGKSIRFKESDARPMGRVSIGSEHELCHVFIGKCNQEPKVDSSEISDWKYLSIEELTRSIEENPSEFTPWLKIEWSEIIGKYYDQLERIIDA